MSRRKMRMMGAITLVIICTVGWYRAARWALSWMRAMVAQAACLYKF